MAIERQTPRVQLTRSTQAHMTARRARNRKIGLGVPVSTSSSVTCPNTCPLKEGGGCLAEQGKLAIHYREVSKGNRGSDWKGFLSEVSSLAEGTLWRHNQGGDLPGVNLQIDGAEIFGLIRANQGRKGFTYTHKPTLDGEAPASVVADNRLLIWIANTNGFAVNLSANNLDHADRLADLGIGPVAAMIPEPQEGQKTTRTPEGRKVVICPNHADPTITCERCRLCAISDPARVIIGLVALNSKAANIAKGERE